MRRAKTSIFDVAFRLAVAATVFVGFAAAPARAQEPSSKVPPPLPSDASPALVQAPPAARCSSVEIIDAGQHFFGGISKGTALIVEKTADQWGQPNGYVLGEEAGGAFIGGLMPRTDAIFDKFGGIAGSAYFVADLGMTALTSAHNDMVVVPIRSGLGLRLGYNVG
jgi:hypothetical protein